MSLHAFSQGTYDYWLKIYKAKYLVKTWEFEKKNDPHPLWIFFPFFGAVSLSNDVTTMYCHLLTTQWTNCFDSNRHMAGDWWSRFDKKKRLR